MALEHVLRMRPARSALTRRLRRHSQGRYSIVIVTHNMAQAGRASDECLLMLLGEVVEHARTEDLFLAAKHRKTAEYIEGRYA